MQVVNVMLTTDGYELLWQSQLDSNPRSVEVCYTIKASYGLVVCQEDELNVRYLDSQNGVCIKSCCKWQDSL